MLQGAPAQSPAEGSVLYAAARASLSPFSVVGIDVGGTKIAGGIACYETRGRTPEVRGYRSVPTKAGEGGAAVLDRIIGLVEELAQEVRKDEGHPLAGVGVATAGRVDAATGTISYANELMPGWTGQPVARAITERTGLACAVLNDVQGHALGELRHGAAAGARTGLMIAAGTGMGGSIIVDGHVVMGANGYAGEVGHTIHPAAAGITCTCGCQSHLESIASGSGIEARYRDLTGQGVSGAEVSRRAAEGEEAAVKVVRLAGRSLGEAIGSLANLLDPEIVVLSGSVCKAGPIWWEALREGLDSQLPHEMRGLPIVEASLGVNAPIIGAAEYLLDRLTR